MRLAVIADDLTGAMDTGLQFSKHGLETVVSMDWQELPDPEALVVDTDSRATRSSEAARRMRHVAARLRERRIYKKVDSTMRGNVGYELRALSDVLSPQAIVVAPAFPQSGRTTLQGRQLVHGHPLEQTFFAHDPRWPMTESHLPTLLMQQAGQEIGQVGLDAVGAGADALVGALQRCPQQIIVVDALDTGHLAMLAEALVRLGPEWVPCGSAGLAEAWAQALGISRQVARERPPETGAPVLIVSGSRNEATVVQLAQAVSQENCLRVDLDSERFRDVEREVARLTGECARSLREGRDTVLTSSFSPLAPGGGPLIARILADVTARLADAESLAGLFVTGGDVAVQVCHALGTKALRIHKELQPGIPVGRLLGGRHEGMWMITKAGGFGDERAVVEALRYMHGRSISATR